MKGKFMATHSERQQALNGTKWWNDIQNIVSLGHNEDDVCKRMYLEEVIKAKNLSPKRLNDLMEVVKVRKAK